MRTSVPFSRGVRISLDYIFAHLECQKPDPEFDAWCDRVIAALENAEELSSLADDSLILIDQI